MWNYFTYNNSRSDAENITGISAFKKSYASQLQVGDVIIMKRSGISRYAHSVIVTSVWNGNVYIAAHSSPAYGKNLNDYSHFKDKTFFAIDGYY